MTVFALEIKRPHDPAIITQRTIHRWYHRRNRCFAVPTAEQSNQLHQDCVQLLVDNDQYHSDPPDIRRIHYTEAACNIRNHGHLPIQYPPIDASDYTVQSQRYNFEHFIDIATADMAEYGAGNCTPESIAFWSLYEKDTKAGWVLVTFRFDQRHISRNAIRELSSQISFTGIDQRYAFFEEGCSGEVEIVYG